VSAVEAVRAEAAEAETGVAAEAVGAARAQAKSLLGGAGADCCVALVESAACSSRVKLIGSPLSVWLVPPLAPALADGGDGGGVCAAGVLIM
jgi:hypothetical protein